MADEDPTEKYKTVKVEVTTVDRPTTAYPLPPSGWGHNAQRVSVEGKVVEIMIKRADKSQFGLRILEDGSVILTSYDAMLTTSLCERNLRLNNERPWE